MGNKILSVLFKRQEFLFRHENGAEIIITAKDEHSAQKKLRSFVLTQMFGAFALIYNDAALRDQLNRIALIKQEAE